MELLNDAFHIEISIEERPLLDRFDVVHNPEKINIDDFYMARVLDITTCDGDVITIALLDIICSGYEPCAVLEGHILTVILFSSILRVDLNSGLIIQFVECDNMGGLFEILPIDGGYIIWGEGEIFRYDLNLNRVWRFAGRDSLVSLMQGKHFWIDDSMIHCRDFEGWHYVLNLDGKLISSFQETAIVETL